ncbi:hypothetical protein GMST_28500 [Geomonas silvestris]|uniref:Uncharacterized protein n=1 Tax=Geomonas silvestris TaxID=2740184 RepID=A0A6V8MKH0_9BACT|nr:hypothetical protein [Geomonas silvestris]GFO60525.1 hypothetical protein GMST_28500 [Geomonas silvestris]
MNLSNQLDARGRFFCKKVAAAALTTAATLLFLCSAILVAPAPSFAKEVPRLEREPANAKVLQLYYNTKDKREYIYNGQEWVPHDASINSYVLKKYKKPKQTSGNGMAAGSSTVGYP